MIKVLYRPIALPRVKRKFRYIIVHDTNCMFPHLDFTKVDNNKSKIAALRAYTLIFDKKYDLNYHYLCEFVGTDWESFVGRPLYRLCEYKDMPDIYQNAIHVCQFGDFNIINGKQRMYQQLAYRVLAPMMFWFKIPLAHVLLHNQVSTNKEIKCPGNMFQFSKMRDNLKTYILK